MELLEALLLQQESQKLIENVSLFILVIVVMVLFLVVKNVMIELRMELLENVIFPVMGLLIILILFVVVSLMALFFRHLLMPLQLDFVLLVRLHLFRLSDQTLLLIHGVVIQVRKAFLVQQMVSPIHLVILPKQVLNQPL